MRFRAHWEATENDYGTFALMHERDRVRVAEFFKDKQTYDAILVLDEVRSDKDHAHYFACIKAAFDSLPEDFGGDFKSPEHLRKWALIKAGYCTAVNTIAKSHAEAQRLALFAKMLDEYAVSTIDRRVVTTYRAVSQSYDEMSRKVFHQSKDDVLNVLSTLLGTSVDELLRSVPRG
jgi:hypothetical protein